MIRKALVIALLIAWGGQAEAQWFKRLRGGSRANVQRATPNVPNRYRTPYPTTTRGMSFGFLSYPQYNYPRPGQFDPYRFDNYVYDPYQFGSFREPDLMNDPYFRERHRNDSMFPGRRSR
ncbi:MAG: hypothetical protein AAF802_07390 [Planctomycetota bacterium]